MFNQRKAKTGETPVKTSVKKLRKMLVALTVTVALLVGFSITAGAWFQASILNKENTISAANYNVTVSVTSDQGTILPGTDGSYTLSANQTYTVTLTAGGTASTGYCLVKLGDTEYHTAPLEPNNNMHFIITPSAAETTCTITPMWGSYSGNENNLIQDNGTIGNGQSSPSNPKKETNDQPDSAVESEASQQPETSQSEPAGEPSSPSSQPVESSQEESSESLPETSESETSSQSEEENSGSPVEESSAEDTQSQVSSAN